MDILKYLDILPQSIIVFLKVFITGIFFIFILSVFNILFNNE